MDNLNNNFSAFRHFSLLDKLSVEQLIVLATRADFRSFGKGKLVLELNSRDTHSYFLFQGEVLLIAADGRQARIKAKSERARQAIAQLQPRQFEVRAITDCKMLIVDQPTLTLMLKDVPVEYESRKTETTSGSNRSPAYAIISKFHQDLQSRRLKLPSLPDLATQIREISERPASKVGDMAKVIMRDPSITAKLIRAANSPLYRGFNEIESCHDAVVRLGMDATRQLITVFASRELFASNSSVLKRRMVKLWDHSLEVGAIAFVLARMTPGISAELAMLAGILHDIGIIPILQYAEEHPELQQDHALLANIISELREEIGCTLLSHWAFPDAVTEAVRHAENYTYESGSERPCYADLVIVAQIHAFIGKPELLSLPPMDEIPAFTKLANGELSPKASLKVLQKSQQEIKDLKRMAG